MKIISKRQAMALYRQHPESGCFASVPGNTPGPAASATMQGRRYRISAASWPCSLNVDRTATARMSYCAVLP